jgi:hypothetical protein
VFIIVIVLVIEQPVSRLNQQTPNAEHRTPNAERNSASTRAGVTAITPALAARPGESVNFIAYLYSLGTIRIEISCLANP